MKKIRIGLAGLGVVGSGVYQILKKDQEIITKKCGKELVITAVCARSKKYFVDDGIRFCEDAKQLAQDPEIDILVEVIGGTEFTKDVVETAIRNGKSVVTANKALIANHGYELAILAKEYGVTLAFEASVAGGAPVIKMFREGLAANEITEFYAILNGTCNFILSKMAEEKIGYDEALKIAQFLGYAESDPSFDVNGIDSAHKLAILGAIASHTKPELNNITIEGITAIDTYEIRLAADLGYKIKLICSYKNENGKIKQTVLPTLINKSEKIAQIDSAFNAVLSKTSNADWSFIVGSGAGSLPTASAIIADLIDIASDRNIPTFGVDIALLKDPQIEKEPEARKFMVKAIINKEEARKNGFAAVIFDEKFHIEQASFIDVEELIICGFITGEIQEKEVKEILSKVDVSTVKEVKYIPILTTNF